MRLAAIVDIPGNASGLEAAVTLCRHSHLPRAMRPASWPLIVNPGRVGCPACDDVTPHLCEAEVATPFADWARGLATGWL